MKRIRNTSVNAASANYPALGTFIVFLLVTAIGLPCIAFSGDVKARLSSNDGSDAFQVMDNSTSVRLHVGSDGKVGIGTTSPAQNLEVAGTVKATAFEGDGSGLTGIVGFSNFFTTGDQTFAPGSVDTFAHGLGGVPSLVVFELVCIVANSGYSVGERVPFSAFFAANSGYRSAGYDATNIFYGIASSRSYLSYKTPNNYFTPNPSYWKVNVRAWR